MNLLDNSMKYTPKGTITVLAHDDVKAKKMVTEMQGKVWAESEGEGMGSKFHIEFPMVPGKVGR